VNTKVYLKYGDQGLSKAFKKELNVILASAMGYGSVGLLVQG